MYFRLIILAFCCAGLGCTGEKTYYALPKEMFLAFGPQGDYKVPLIDSTRKIYTWGAHVSSVKGFEGYAKFSPGYYEDIIEVNYSMLGGDTVGYDTALSQYVIEYLSLQMKVNSGPYLNSGEVEVYVESEAATNQNTQKSFTIKQVLKKDTLINGLVLNSIEMKNFHDDYTSDSSDIFIEKLKFIEGIGLVELKGLTYCTQRSPSCRKFWFRQP
jgi:hypothetical protein